LSPDPAWLRALERLRPALDTVKATPICNEIKRIQVELRDEVWKALENEDWEDAHSLSHELLELYRFKLLMCKD